jgi:hypothetical protein
MNDTDPIINDFDPQSLYQDPDCAVNSPLYRMVTLVAPTGNAMPLPLTETCAPVPLAFRISENALDRLSAGGKQFFQTMLEPTIKHV